MSTPILQLQSLHKSFGALTVCDGMELDVPEGQALGILGPNGAGKSTLFNLIAGGLRPDSGRVIFRGNDVTRHSIHRRCHAGLGRSYQIPHPFTGMSVFENVLVGACFGTGHAERHAYDRCAAILETTGLLAKANTLAGSLTLLERKRLELARAMATQPSLLLLDEIAGGLTEHECESLVETIRDIHGSGTTIIWIEHVVHALLSVAERLMVIDFGRKVADGEPDTVMADSQVQQIYMGIEAA